MGYNFKAGQIRILWSLGHYDGMCTGVGWLDGKPVYIDKGEFGGWGVKEEWRELEYKLDELLSEEDAEQIWERVERDYDEQMYECTERTFTVKTLSLEQFERLKREHREWQLHAGLHTDYYYDESGKPLRSSKYHWRLSREYLKVHYYDVVPKGDESVRKGDVLGTITWTELFAESDLRSDALEDPCSPELKVYQRNWKPGDRVRLNW